MVLVILICFLSAPVLADQSEEAARKAMEAAYVQSGINVRVNEFIENKVPKEYREVAAKVGYAATLIQQQRIEYRWEW